MTILFLVETRHTGPPLALRTCRTGPTSQVFAIPPVAGRHAICPRITLGCRHERDPEVLRTFCRVRKEWAG